MSATLLFGISSLVTNDEAVRDAAHAQPESQAAPEEERISRCRFCAILDP